MKLDIIKSIVKILLPAIAAWCGATLTGCSCVPVIFN